MSRIKISLSDFTFRIAGYGCYMVNYTSPSTGKSWRGARVTDMPLIDRTKNSEAPLVKDLNALKRYCKMYGY